MSTQQGTQSEPYELPKEASVYLWSADTFDSLRKILTDSGIDESKLSALSVGVLRLASGKQKPSEFLHGIQVAFELDDTAARELAVKISSQVLSKIANDLPFDFKEVIKEWGGTDAQIAEDIETPVNAQTFVKSYVASILQSADARVQHRLEMLFVDILQGELSHDDALVKLMRSSKLGGLGLDETAASAVLTRFSEQSKGLKVEKQITDKNEKESADNEQATENKKTETPPVLETFDEEDEAEIKKIESQKKHVPKIPAPRTVEEVVERVCENSAFAFDDRALLDRCRKIIESRAREVRDAFETRAKLEQSIDVGGLGIAGRQLADMMKEIETQIRAYEMLMATKVDKDKVVAKQASEKAQVDRRNRIKKNEEIMNDRHTAMTGAVSPELVKPAGPSQSRTSVAVSAHHEMLQREGRIDVDKLKSAVEASRTPETVSVPKPRPKGSPSMQEVTFEKRLSGPIDELTTMDLTDFRRISKDPAQAIRKIQDKVDLLESEGYERKIAAVNAWRKSPVHQLYVKVTQQAVLKGVPVVEMLEEKRQAGGEIFTEEELKAVMSLNAQLRF